MKAEPGQSRPHSFIQLPARQLLKELTDFGDTGPDYWGHNVVLGGPKEG